MKAIQPILFWLLVASVAGCGDSACEELRASTCFSEVPEQEECDLDGADECSACFVDNVADDCSNAGELDAKCASACERFNAAR